MPRYNPWKSGCAIASMVVGVLCLVGLDFWEVHADLKHPLKAARRFNRHSDLHLDHKQQLRVRLSGPSDERDLRSQLSLKRSPQVNCRGLNEH